MFSGPLLGLLLVSSELALLALKAAFQMARLPVEKPEWQCLGVMKHLDRHWDGDPKAMHQTLKHQLGDAQF